MTDLLDVMPQAAAPPNAVAGVVTAVEGADVYAILPSFDLRHRFGPLFGTTGAGVIVGDECLVVFDESGDPWYAAPAKGGGGGDTNVDATASATTLAPGSAATVVVTEPTDNLFDFAFGIPRGDVGAQGAAGAQGPKGDTGAQGPPGPAGPDNYARFARTGGQTLSNNVDTNLAWNTAVEAVGTLPPTLADSNTAIQINEAGTYVIVFGGWFQDSAVGRRILSIYHWRASSMNVIARQSWAIPGNNNPSGPMVAVYRCQVNDRFYCRAFQDSGGNLDFTGGGAITPGVMVAKITGAQGPQGPQGPAGGSATVPMDTWHQVGAAGEPAFLNTWHNLDASSGTARNVRFTKDPLGRVHLTGLASGGPNASVIFTLPAGYRPTRINQLFNSVAASGDCQIAVALNGDVSAANLNTGNVTTWAALDGIIFDTETVTQMPTGPQGPAGKVPVARAYDFGATRQATVGSYAEVPNMRMAVNLTTGNYVRLSVRGQFEHTASGVQYLVLNIFDVTANAMLPNNAAYFVARAWAPGQNYTYVHDVILPVAASGAAGYVQPGPRTLAVQASTGNATCSLRNDTVPMVFTAEELQQ